MKVIDPGHEYLIEALDGGEPQTMRFVKREGANYPGNVGAHGGPITQEYLRAILHRCVYMNNQGGCAETDIIIASLRTAIMAFEVRAARCRGSSIELAHLSDIDTEPTCPTCGHIQCDPARHSQPHWSETRRGPTWDLPIEVLELSVRTSNMLRNAGINTVGALVRTSEDAMKAIPHMGAKSRREIQAVIASITGQGEIPF